MIISASRRTDIPAFYSQWFFNRIKEGYVLVPNPYHPKMISKISLSPAVVDCFVFWTKNPAPMLNQLEKLQDYNYYFQFTLNPYGEKLENHLPSIDKRMDTFKKLADKIGRERVIWRYDPILTNEEYNVSFHQEAFARIADELKDHTAKCMLGFIDHYQHIRNSVRLFNIHPLTQEEIEEMAVSFKKTIDVYPDIQLDTCTVKVDLRHLGIPSGLCIDKDLIEKIIGYPILAQKDKNQRNICNCIESIDIGTYESCLNGCIYCYAIKGNYNTTEIKGIKEIWPVIEVPVVIKIEDYTETTTFSGIDMNAFGKNPTQNELGKMPLLLLGNGSLRDMKDYNNHAISKKQQEKFLEMGENLNIFYSLDEKEKDTSKATDDLTTLSSNSARGPQTSYMPCKAAVVIEDNEIYIPISQAQDLCREIGEPSEISKVYLKINGNKDIAIPNYKTSSLLR